MRNVRRIKINKITEQVSSAQWKDKYDSLLLIVEDLRTDLYDRDIKIKSLEGVIQGLKCTEDEATYWASMYKAMKIQRDNNLLEYRTWRLTKE